MFKIYAGSKSHGFLHILQEATFVFFNLRLDGIFSQELSWCPFSNLRPVSKILLKSSFILYLFAVVFLVFILCWIKKSLKGTDRKINRSRFHGGILRLILISYAGITATCFSLLSCVHLGHHGQVLFIDGSIPCHRWWQILVICVVCCWIVPFPVAIYTSSQLLHNNELSSRTYYCSLLFPLPGICYWLYNRKKVPRNESEHLETQDQGAQDALQIIEGPFRKSSNCDPRKNHRLSWESVLVGRRLVLIFIKTFLINTFARLCVMLVCTIMFLMHHIYCKPFSVSLLNNIETLSLFMLSVVCLLNLVPAYNYTYPAYSQDHIDNVMQILRVSETGLNLVFPFVIGLFVAVLICVRILQSTFWLCRCFVKFIRYCSKYKVC